MFDHLNEIIMESISGDLDINLLTTSLAMSTSKLYKKVKTLTGLSSNLGFSMILVYAASMFFIVTPYTNIEKLYIPLVCCGFGHVAIFIALTVYAYHR